MKRRHIAAATLCLFAIIGEGRAKLIPEPRSYHPFDLFNNGYKEKLQSDGTWRIVAASRAQIDGFGFSNDMALYRAAEITVSFGRKYFQVVNATGTSTMTYNTPFRETVIVIVRPVDTNDAPLECQSKHPNVCGTFEAAPILARIGPTLHK